MENSTLEEDTFPSSQVIYGSSDIDLDIKIEPRQLSECLDDFSDPMFLNPEDFSENFHGFGAETKIPGRLIVKEEEDDIKVFRLKRTGRPRGDTVKNRGQI